MPALLANRSGEETVIDRRGDTIQVQIEGHAVFRAEAKIYVGAVGGELAAIDEKQPTDFDVTPICFDRKSSVEACNPYGAAVRIQPQVAEQVTHLDFGAIILNSEIDAS